VNRQKAKGRRERGSFFAIPHSILDSVNYNRLSSHAVKLLIDLGRQYNGSNNGDLSTAWKIMKPKGWRSKSTLHSAKQELLHYGLIELTRQGGKHKPSLYGLTWHAINDCRGKLDVAESKTPSNQWRNPRPDYKN
jgi:hypothetical protein